MHRPVKHRPEHTLLPRPVAIARFEERLGRAIPLHPNTLSAMKLLVATPAMAWALGDLTGGGLGGGAASMAAALLVFALFALLDYLDGVVARERHLETEFGRLFDRVTDYPMLVLLGMHCAQLIAPAALGLKLGLDLLLLVLFAAGLGSTQNRLRTSLTYATLFSLLLLGQGWAPRLITAGAVTTIVSVNVGFSALVALYNMRVLNKRYIADVLSLANLGCGVVGMFFAAQGQLHFSVLMLLFGAAFDGLDGAAARRWGGTRFGVYSDDLADAVSYGLAPAFALAITFSGPTGWFVGGAYAVFTIARLVHFTRTKDTTEEGMFRGAPSTLGGLITLSSLALFGDEPLLVGLLVGASCVLMTSFGTRYAHVRRLAPYKLIVAPLAAVGGVGLAVAAVVLGPLVAVAGLLAGALTYGFAPIVVTLARSA